MSPDWSCTVLVHNRTCCGKYRILYVLIDLCNFLISDSTCIVPAWIMYRLDWVFYWTQFESTYKAYF